MKSKLKLLFITFCVVLFFVSCSTLDAIKSDISEAFSGIKNIEKSSDYAENGGSLFTVKYQVPKDYSKAYSFRTGKPHSLLKKIPAEVTKLRTANPSQYVKKTCDFIKANSTDDFERIKIAHDIVAVNIKYDAAGYWSGNLPEQDYETVLKTGLAVCEGYSNTLGRFLDVLGFKNQIVHGYARGVGTSLLEESEIESNHAWNMVKIADEYYLIDCTWDSGYMNGKKSVQEYTTDYLFLKPEHFIYTHYPESKGNQLLDSPVTKKEFIELADFEPKFFDAVQFSELPKKQNECKSSVQFEYNLISDGTLSFVVTDCSTNKKIQNAVFNLKTDKNVKTMIQFPKAANYRISLFYRPKNAKSGSFCGEFYVKAEEASSVQYPEVYENSFNASLISPLEMPLKRGQSYHFEVSCPEKNFVAIINGKTFTQMNKNEKGNFELDFVIPSNCSKINIGAASSERGNYQTAAAFICK